MEIGYSVWMVLIVILGGLMAIYVIMKNANEWFYVRRFGKKRVLLPPGDMGWPFIGTQLSFLKAFKSDNPDSFISNFAARFGQRGIYRAVMFGKPCVIVTTPESCKRVLSDDTTFGPGFPESITKLMGKKAFHGISQEEHKRLRRLTTAALSGQEALSVYLKHIEQIVITSLEEWSSMSKPIEFLTEMRKIAFKVIMYVMVGERSTDHLIMEALEREYTTLNHGLKSMAIDLPGFAYHNALKDPKTRENFIPFGAGSRMCPGRDLAKLEVYVFLHYFLLNYKLERINPGRHVTYLPISRPVDNCLAKVTRVTMQHSY